MRPWLLLLPLALWPGEAVAAHCAHGEFYIVHQHKCVPKAERHRFSGVSTQVIPARNSDPEPPPKPPRPVAARATPAEPPAESATPRGDRIREPKPYQERAPTAELAIPYDLPRSIMNRAYTPNFELLR
jgi:hypothetical protein